MADLPNLNTEQIGPIGFWNVTDHSDAETIDPSEAVKYARVESYTDYDNGIDGTLHQEFVGRTFNFRIKADGWIIIWLPRSASYTTSSSIGDVNGYWDIIYDWTEYGTANNNLPISIITHEIDQLRQQLSVDATFNESDTGLYNYEFPNSTSVIVGSELETDGTNSDISGGMSYNDYTTRHHHNVVASCYADTGEQSTVTFGGQTIASAADGVESYGSTDVLADDLMPESQTVYRNDGTLTGASYMKITHLIWQEV